MTFVGGSMSFLRIARARLETVAALLLSVGSSKRWWLLPMIVILLAFGVVAILGQVPAVEPFIYTLF